MLVAAHRSPRLANSDDLDAQLARLDAIAAPIAPADLEAWRRRMFVELGFAGNGEDYHDVRNSLLPEVMDRRTGIPITLAVLGMEVGRRCGLAFDGVGMPGHFLVQHRESGAYVDAFNGGEVIDLEGCARIFQRLYPERLFDPRHLVVVDAHAILIRMLSNLKANYARMRDLDGLTSVMRMRLLLPMPSLDEGRELVRLLDATGHWAEASDALDQLVAGWPSAGEILDGERSRLLGKLN